MLEYETVFGIPDFLNENKNNKSFSLKNNYQKEDTKDIITMLEKSTIEDLDIIKEKFSIDDELIKKYRILKNKVLINSLEVDELPVLYSNLERLGILSPSSVIAKKYQSLTADDEPKPQSVFTVFVAGALVVVTVAVYAISLHTVSAAINGHSAINVYTSVNIKGYALKRTLIKLIDIALELHPNLEIVVNNMFENISDERKKQILSYIIENSIEELDLNLKNNKLNIEKLEGVLCQEKVF